MVFAYIYNSYTKGAVNVISRPDDIIIKKEDESLHLSPNASVGKDIPSPEVVIPPTIEAEDPVGIYEQLKIDEDVVNILLMGMDARNYEDLSRSDTMILISYKVSDGTIKMLSFMRDSWVYIPNKYWSRINTATAIGGPGLLINTINENFNLDIQDYVQIKFDDFKTVIDIIGGVPIELSLKEVQYINKKMHVEDGVYDNDLPNEAGLYTLNGEQSLWHCRNRSVGNSDFARTERQRNVLEAILNKIRKDVSLKQVAELVYTMKDYINTNLDLDMIIKLGTSILMQENISIETERVPFDGAYTSANKNGASVLEINIDKTTSMIHEFLYPEEITE